MNFLLGLAIVILFWKPIIFIILLIMILLGGI